MYLKKEEGRGKIPINADESNISVNGLSHVQLVVEFMYVLSSTYPIMITTQTVIGTVMACGSSCILFSISESFSHDVMLVAMLPLSL